MAPRELNLGDHGDTSTTRVRENRRCRRNSRRTDDQIDTVQGTGGMPPEITTRPLRELAEALAELPLRPQIGSTDVGAIMGRETRSRQTGSTQPDDQDP
jgi:hypothetical protein